MALYNPDLVDQKVKNNLLSLMVEYNSGLITARLGEMFYHLVENRASATESTLSPELDKVADYYPNDGRSVIVGFHLTLEKEGNFTPLAFRLPNGSKNELPGPHLIEELIEPHLAGLSYPAKTNTWAATCEEWLRICNADWVANTVKKAGYPMPAEQEIAGWMSGYIAYEVEFY
jgi:hypothetical protein